MVRDHACHEVDIGITGKLDSHSLVHFGVDGREGRRRFAFRQIGILHVVHAVHIVHVMPGTGFSHFHAAHAAGLLHALAAAVFGIGDRGRKEQRGSEKNNSRFHRRSFHRSASR